MSTPQPVVELTEEEKLIASDPEAKFTEERILHLLTRERKCVLLTGRAGTGKSTMISSVVAKLGRYLVAENKEWLTIEVTAMTGLAAFSIPSCVGKTVHSCLGIQVNTTRDTMDKYLTLMARTAIKKIGFLIIDEVSMLSASLLTEIDAFLRGVKNYDKFMGGIPTLFSGDFMQLPPVEKDQKQMLAFQAGVFQKNVENVAYLTKSHRQGNEATFVGILQQVRIAHLDDNVCSALQERDVSRHREFLANSKIKPTVLYSTNRLVDAENEAELRKLEGEEVVYESRHFIRKRKDKYTFIYSELEETSPEKERVATLFDDGSLIPRTLRLRVGAQVMYLTNKKSSRLMNGSRGVVVGFAENTKMPIVQFIEIQDPIELAPEHAPKEKGDGKYRTCYTRKQIPLKLAWALTIHKSQGLTLDRAIVHFTDAFAPSAIYVALSRLKSIDGLFVVGFDRRKIKTDQRALAFYAKFDPEIAAHCQQRGISLEYPIYTGAPYEAKDKRRGRSETETREETEEATSNGFGGRKRKWSGNKGKSKKI